MVKHCCRAQSMIRMSPAPLSHIPCSSESPGLGRQEGVSFPPTCPRHVELDRPILRRLTANREANPAAWLGQFFNTKFIKMAVFCPEPFLLQSFLTENSNLSSYQEPNSFQKGNHVRSSLTCNKIIFCMCPSWESCIDVGGGRGGRHTTKGGDWFFFISLKLNIHPQTP